MANNSIYAAFDRMWQHIVARLGDKAELEHEHENLNEAISNIISGTTEVAKATTATKDGSGNIISDTYETKENAEAKLAEAKEYTNTIASGKADTNHNHDSLYDTKGAADNAFESSKEYTDTAVANLVNSAPETLDTIGELATAFQENKDMVETLNNAITNKAEKTDVVQSDWNETDDTKLDYIKNRPFFDDTQTFVDFDGDVSGITDIVDVNGMNWYKIGQPALQEHIIGSTMILNDETSKIITVDDFKVVYEDGLWMIAMNSSNLPIYNIPYNGYTMEGLTFDKAGLYCIDPGFTGVYPVLITKGELKKIDEKFLPELGVGVRNGTGEAFNQYNSNNNKATGDYSHAEGRITEASGYAAHAEGMSNHATEECAHAEGKFTTASGFISHAEGVDTLASGDYTHAQGWLTKATASAAHAEGYNTEANGEYSHAEGRYTRANGNTQHVQGRFNIVDDENKYAHIVGNGTQEALRSNAHTIDWDGNAEFQGDIVAYGCGSDETPISLKEVSGKVGAGKDWNVNDETNPAYIKNRPFYTTDPVESAVVEETTITLQDDGTGQLTFIQPLEVGQEYAITLDGTTYNCVAKMIGVMPYVGNGGLISAGEDTGEPFVIVPIGSDTELGIMINSDVLEHTVGIIAITSEVHKLDEKYIPDSLKELIDKKPGLKVEGKTFSVYNPENDNYEEVTALDGAEIFNDYGENIATGVYSHAEGFSTEAFGANSHAEGADTKASGDYSHAENGGTNASGSHSHAEGWGTNASGSTSHAEGYQTIASGEYQHVQGKFNIKDTENKYAHIVGNGEENTRSNAHTLDWDGNAEFQGDVKANACGGATPISLVEVNDKVNAGQDWSQNDETAADFIKNRPFYADESLGTVLFDDTATFTENSFTGSYFYAFSTGITLVMGRSYKVIFDGVTYDNLIAFDPWDSGHNVLGNSDYTTEALDSGDYPFQITEQSIRVSLNNGDSHSITIVDMSKSYVMLPKEYVSYKPGMVVSGQTFVNSDGTEMVAGVFAEVFNNNITNIATGQSSHAEGDGTEATGGCSHAEGIFTTASGHNSHAEGSGSTASGLNSHAEGGTTKATGSYSHAECRDTTASGESSHAEGYYTVASGIRSHAEGWQTIAAGQYQHTQGKFNIEDTNNTYAHIVGNGTSKTARSNAHTLDWSGNAWYQGTVEATAIILKSPNGTRFKITVGDDGVLTSTEITE